MNGAKFTPGPWTFDWEDDNRTWAIVKSPTGKIVANVNTESGPDIAPLVSDKMPAQANAQLISAAPDLFEALKKAIDALERADDSFGVPGLHGIINEADAAIRKAEGE